MSLIGKLLPTGGVWVMIVISRVFIFVIVIHTKFTRSRLLGFLVSGQYDQYVKNDERVMSFWFKALDKDHKHYKLCFLIDHALSTTPTQANQLCIA